MRGEISHWILWKIVEIILTIQDFRNFGPLSATQISQGRPILLKDAKVSFALTITSNVGYLHHAHLSPSVLRCQGLYITNHDLVRCGGWVLYNSGASASARCGRVEEILLRASDSAPFGMLIAKALETNHHPNDNIQAHGKDDCKTRMSQILGGVFV